MNLPRYFLLSATLALSFLRFDPANAEDAPPVSQFYIKVGKLIDVEKGVVLTGQCITVSGAYFSGYTRCKAKAPANMRRLDWSKYSVVPGLIDLHTHLADAGQSAELDAPIKTSPQLTAIIGARNAEATLRAGFTAVRDVGTYRGLTDVALRDAIVREIVIGPRMAVAGAYITHPGGGGELNGVMANSELPGDMRLGVAQGTDQVRARAEYLFDHGVDFLKLMATGAVLAIGTEPGAPELSEAEMRAAVDVAKSRGSYATAHGHGASGIKAAIRAGVRSIEHASLMDEEGLALAKTAGVWLVMDIYNGDYIDAVGTREKWPEEYLRKNRETTDVQRQAFAKAVKAGVKLAFGTDSGVYPHGDNARQFSYMVRYGMTPMQAIQSATIEAARVMGQEKQLGSIAPQKFADLVVIKGDPTRDVTLLEHPILVMKAGRLFTGRGQERKPSNQPE